MRILCDWYRVRRQWASCLGLVTIFLLTAPVMWPQDMLPQGTSPESRALPSGFRLNSLSASVGRNYLMVPNWTAAPLESYMLSYGGGLDAGVYLPGKTSSASLDYGLSYNGNTTYGQLNGFDHRLFFSWTRTLTRTLSLSVAASGESTTVQGFLYQSSTGAAPDLSNAGALASSLAPAGTAGATQTILYPARRQTAMLATTLSYSPSARLSWHLSMHGQRLLPSNSYGSGTQQGYRYPGETDSGASLALSYALSRRTSLGVEVGYFRVLSRLGTTQAGSTGFSLTRVLGRHWFGSGLVGYGLGDYYIAASRTSARRPDFTGRATIGTSFDAQTISFSAAQRIGDSYGFGAQRTVEGNFAWIWHPQRQKWAFQATAAYERLTGIQVSRIQSAVIRGALTRRLTRTMSCTAEGGYSWGLQASASLGQETQNGARFSIVWRPAGTLW